MRARRWSGQAAVTSFLISIVVAGVGVASPYELRCSQECTSEACLAQCAHSGPKHTLRTVRMWQSSRLALAVTPFTLGVAVVRRAVLKNSDTFGACGSLAGGATASSCGQNRR